MESVHAPRTGRVDRILLAFGLLVLAWATTAFVCALTQAGSITALFHQYMVATGLVKPLFTEVEYYAHIKGIEYLISVAFFVIFPVFYRYVNRETEQMRVLEPGS